MPTSRPSRKPARRRFPRLPETILGLNGHQLGTIIVAIASLLGIGKAQQEIGNQADNASRAYGELASANVKLRAQIDSLRVAVVEIRGGLHHLELEQRSSSRRITRQVETVAAVTDSVVAAPPRRGPVSSAWNWLTSPFRKKEAP